jgi:hypothetical protein
VRASLFALEEITRVPDSLGGSSGARGGPGESEAPRLGRARKPGPARNAIEYLPKSLI